MEFAFNPPLGASCGNSRMAPIDFNFLFVVFLESTQRPPEGEGKNDQATNPNDCAATSFWNPFSPFLRASSAAGGPHSIGAQSRFTGYAQSVQNIPWRNILHGRSIAFFRGRLRQAGVATERNPNGPAHRPTHPFSRREPPPPNAGLSLPLKCAIVYEDSRKYLDTLSGRTIYKEAFGQTLPPQDWSGADCVFRLGKCASNQPPRRVQRQRE